MYTFLVLATTECMLLAAMAYDRHVAVRFPCRYTVTMSNRKCVTLISLSWLSGLVLPITHIVLTWRLPYCGPGVIDHFFCEMPAVLQLVCVDKYLIKLITQLGCLFTLLMPTTFIVFFYMNIMVAILKINSAKGREKAFFTCLSHLMVVVLFYGSAMKHVHETKLFSFPSEGQNCLYLIQYIYSNAKSNYLQPKEHRGQESIGEAS